MSSWRWFYLSVGLFRAFIPSRWESGFNLKTPSLLLPDSKHSRKMLLLKGCVQSELCPDINRAAMQVMDKLGITLIEDQRSNNCCGAMSHHLSYSADAQKHMRNNIDAWWPHVEDGVEAILLTASGCAPHVKDYSRLMANDNEYAKKATRISDLAKDISEIILELDIKKLKNLEKPTLVAFQSSCSLQHGLKVSGVVENLLTSLGYELTEVQNPHLCCGAAGTYSVLQSKISDQLLINKIVALEKGKPHFIASANIGCILHLQRDASIPVRHWVELLAEYNL